MPHRSPNHTPNPLDITPRAVWRLTWPQLLMMYLMFFMGFVAVWVAGRIDADVQAALGMVSQAGVFMMVLAMSVSSGATAAVSQSLGALRQSRANHYVGATVIGCLGLGLVAALCGWCFADPILRLIRVPEAILPQTRVMWRVTMLGMPAQYVYAATGVMFRATRLVLPPLFVEALVCVANTFAALGLGLGWFGLPDCGYLGLVWAGVGAQVLGAICNCLLLARAGYLSRRALPGPRWLAAGLPYLLRVALPAGAAQIVWHSGYLCLFVLVASLPRDSVNALAGLTAGLRVEALLFLPAMAFNMSAAVLVGNMLGAGRAGEARRVARNLMLLAALVMSLVAACLWPFREAIAARLSHDPGAQAQIVSYLSYNLLSTPFSVASTVMGGIMTGAGATRYNLMIFGGTFWVLRLPLGWLLGHRLWGAADGVFCAMLVSQIAQSCLMLHVLLRRDWTRFAMRKTAPGRPPEPSARRTP